MRKRRIAILFGGCSPEYSVSLASAYSVLCHLDRSRYLPLLVGISQEGDWFYYDGTPEKLAEDRWCNPMDCKPACFSPNRRDRALLVFGPDGTETISVDVVFPILHGKNGEDGTVQGLLELTGIPLVGCGTLSSALCMDKDRAHRLVRAAGILVPEAVVLDKPLQEETVFLQGDKLGYPLFVKPVRAGSSYGVTKVDNAKELPAAIRCAFQYDDQVILEQNIPGFEVGCAVMGNRNLTVGEVDEIQLSGGFFDFTEKYTLKTSSIHVPARIGPEQSAKIKETAKLIYRVLGCRGFARVDLFLTPSGRIVFNEVNTIPGFTSHSRFPSMMCAAGISFEEILCHVIELAVEAC